MRKNGNHSHLIQSNPAQISGVDMDGMDG